MKTSRLLAIFILLSTGFSAISQNRMLPDIDIYTLVGSRVSARDIRMNDQPVVLVFWNPDDRQSLDQVKMLNEEYESNLKVKNVKVIGICTDCSGTMERIRPLVNGTGIDFEIFIDRNNELKRALNVPYVPFTIINDPNKDVYCRYIGYCFNVGDLITSTIENSLANSNNSR